MARRFFYISHGVLALALAYNLGAGSAGAQSGGAFVSVSAHISNPPAVYALTSAGGL